MKKLITLLLLFTLVGFLSGNQVVITNDYQYIVSEGKTYNFNNGSESNNVKYDRTNKIAIQNNKVLADPLKYHYAFFWDEVDSFIGYYKTNKGITTSGAYLGQVNTQSIPLPLNAYSFALVRYDNDYVLVNGFTIEELFIDNNLADVDPDDFNDIPIAELNGLTLNEVFNDNNLILNGDFSDGTTGWSTQASWTISSGIGTYLSGSNQRITKTGLNLINEDIYLRMDTFGITPAPSIAIFTSTSTIQGTYISVIEPFMSFKSSNISGIDLRIFGSGLVGSSYSIDNVYLIPLTTLNIGTLTKEQLDTYFNIYQNGFNATYYATDGNVSSVDGYYYAAGKNLFDISQTINSGRILRTTGLLERINTTNILVSNDELSFNNNISTSGITTSFININENIEYHSSFDILIGGTIYHRTVAFYDENFIFISDFNNPATVNFITFTTPINTKYIRLDIVSTAIGFVKVNNIQLEQGSTSTSYEAFATPTTTLNLTFLFGVGNEPDKATMDGYYAEYEEYLEYLYVCCDIFATQTISFETIYFDDGVSTEIEKLGSILIFTLIGFTLMIFGFASKRRIFNLLSIGAFIVLGVLLAEFAGFLIIVFGLVVLNLYYTFLGDI
jgi:hypothetical protein